MAEVGGQPEQGRLRDRRSYSEYRDSGIEWLGEIPAHWRLKSLKHSVARLESGGTPESDNTTYWTDEEHGIPWIAISDMTRGFHVHETAKRITEEGRKSKRLLILPAGTLLYSMYASLGKVAVLEIEAVVNQAILGVVPREGEVLRDYLRWWFEFMQPYVPMLSSSNTQDNLSAERVRNMPVVLPVAVEEQHAIADFLDHETAKIDALVAKKEQLIELLQEKRSALITRAVTRGLDPTVPMKDSGVHWLGQVPAHWGVVPLKRTIDYVEGPGIMATDFQLEGVPLLRISGIGGRWATIEGCNYLSPDVVRRRWSHFRVRSGDLLISGSASTGFCTEVDGGTAGAIPYTGIIIMRPKAGQMSKHFVRWLLLSEVISTQVDLARSGSTIQHFGPSHLAKMRVVAPPLRQQIGIAEHLDSETSQIDRLVDGVHRVIDLLTEYRTALISAAVTGKIDVRKEAA